MTKASTDGLADDQRQALSRDLSFIQETLDLWEACALPQDVKDLLAEAHDVMEEIRSKAGILPWLEDEEQGSTMTDMNIMALGDEHQALTVAHPWPVLLAFRASIPEPAARDVAERFAADHGLTLMPGFPREAIGEDDYEAIEEAFRCDPALDCVAHEMRRIFTVVRCDRCQRGMYLAIGGDDDLLEAAQAEDPQATARIEQARDDFLATHQMECAA